MLARLNRFEAARIFCNTLRIFSWSFGLKFFFYDDSDTFKNLK